MAEFNNILLMGLPASGKTTYAKELCKQDRYTLISSDTIRKQLWGEEEIQGPWPKIWAEVQKQLQGNSLPIIYDATNITAEHRAIALKKLSRYSNRPWAAIFIKTPLETCLQHNAERERNIPEEAIHSMHSKLETPTKAEGFTSVTIIDS